MSMTQEELQKLLDEFGQSEIAQTPQWKIDRNEQLSSVCGIASKSTHQKDIGRQIRIKGNLKMKMIKIEKFKNVLNLIDKDIFQLKDVADACIQFGLKHPKEYAKRICREKLVCKQIHKGYNQYNPSLYKKIY